MRDVQEILSELEKIGVKDRKIREYIGLKDRQTIGRWWNGQRPIHKNLFKLKRLLEIAQKYQTYDLPTLKEVMHSIVRLRENEGFTPEANEMMAEIIKHHRAKTDWSEGPIVTPRVGMELVTKYHPNWYTRKKFSEILVLL